MSDAVPPDGPPDAAAPIRAALAGAAPHPTNVVNFRQPSRSGGSAEGPSGRGAGGGAPPAPELAIACALRPLTDLGNAERFVARFGDRFRWVKEWGWLAWDGRRWNGPQAELALGTAIHETVRAIQDEAAALAETGLHPDDGGNAAGLDRVTKRDRNDEATELLSDRVRRWGRQSEASARIEAIEKLAKPKLSAATADFDCDPMLVNVMNGTLHLSRAGEGCSDALAELRPHRPEDMLTKLAPVAWDPAATCPRWDAFMAEVQPDPAIRRFLDAWAGYSLTGDTSEQVFVINHGLGANGKSVWADVLGHLAGDYGMSISIETFLDNERGRRGGEATPDLAELPGRRFVRTSEPKRGRSFAEELIKLITGQEPMMVRRLNRDFFEFTPVLKITVSANQRPSASSDAAFWRRVILVPWEIVIPPERRDRNLAHELRAEASGILNRVIAGALDWMSGGLPVADRIREVTAAYRADRDPLGRFLEMATEPDPEGRVQSSELYRLFLAWAKWAGEGEWTQKGFSRAMSDRGFEKLQSNTIQWLGLRTTKDVAFFGSPEGDPQGWHAGGWDD